MHNNLLCLFFTNAYIYKIRNHQGSPRKIIIFLYKEQRYFYKAIFLFLFIFFTYDLNGAAGGACKDYGECDKFDYSLNDIESLQRGASTYINYCYGCHSLQYSRWGRVANDLQIPEDIFFENLVFDKSIRPGDLMTGAMPEDSANWFGVAPPDLTLVSRYKGDD